MPAWLTEVLRLLGFATPLVYAAATYGLFRWLDKTAPDTAKRALTERLQSTRPQTGSRRFAIETFDFVYTTPLLHWRALVRCLSVIAVASAIIWYETGILVARQYAWRDLGVLLATNTVSGYLSLFFARACLILINRWPIVGLFVAAVVGAAMAAVFEIGCELLVTYLLIGVKSVLYTILFSASMMLSGPAIFLPGAAVCVWFPLLALAVIMTQMSVWVLESSGRMQWFLAQARHHPFRAVGPAAAMLVLVTGVVLQTLIR